MAISEKTRKLLWGKSGNLCAICHEILSREKTEHDSHAIIGEEAHIISKSGKGPRFQADVIIEFDDYDNLILLCANHHTIIDKQPVQYTARYLHNLKKEHEQWVKETFFTAQDKMRNKLFCLCK